MDPWAGKMMPWRRGWRPLFHISGLGCISVRLAAICQPRRQVGWKQAIAKVGRIRVRAERVITVQGGVLGSERDAYGAAGLICLGACLWQGWGVRPAAMEERAGGRGWIPSPSYRVKGLRIRHPAHHLHPLPHTLPAIPPQRSQAGELYGSNCRMIVGRSL